MIRRNTFECVYVPPVSVCVCVCARMRVFVCLYFCFCVICRSDSLTTHSKYCSFFRSSVLTGRSDSPATTSGHVRFTLRNQISFTHILTHTHTHSKIYIDRPSVYLCLHPAGRSRWYRKIKTLSAILKASINSVFMRCYESRSFMRREKQTNWFLRPP